ncbi:Imm49 family immunity protein [Nocardiopsis aegyptia]|uniref:Imm49 family immunity protein n=1 Tax=Nocardiopsis aegyptia TaxID=220378 RepID=UPI0036719C3F
MTPEPDPAGRAQMDALCAYLAADARDRPVSTLCEPTSTERATALRRLEAAAELTPDQRLLRVLLGGEPALFEQALAEHLVRYRESVSQDAPPRSLLPVVAIALAALAVQVHGWDLEVRSGYLPQALLGSSEWASAS